MMSTNFRIAIRESATEIDAAMADKVAGATSTTINSPDACTLDHSTDCWVSGGNMVSNDDSSPGAGAAASIGG